MKELLMVALAVIVAGCQSYRLTETTQYLRVRVKITASDDSAADKKLADIVSPNVQKALCDAGFEVVCSGDAELEVSGSAKCLAGMARGNRTVCRGTLELTFKRMDVRNPATGNEIRRLINAKRFDAKSGEAWTQEEAVMSLGDNLTANVGKWLRESSTSMADNIALCNIAVKSSDGHSQIEKNYPTEFTKTVLGIQGIYACRSTPLNQTRTMFTVSVLYDTRQIPDGVVNRLMSMPALNLE